jgi:V/A-type H+-transporting ATPase subunit E
LKRISLGAGGSCLLVDTGLFLGRIRIMAEELQALLDKINAQGIAKAESEREEVLAKARAEAKHLVEEAGQEAERIVQQARDEAELLTEKGRESLRQAARDTLLSLRETLQERMRQVAVECVGKETDISELGKIIAELLTNLAASEGDETDTVAVLVPEGREADVRDILLAALGKNLKKNVSIAPLKALSGGFKLDFRDHKVTYDFSDKALAEVLCTFVHPRLAELLRSAVDTKDAGASAEAEGEDR